MTWKEGIVIMVVLHLSRGVSLGVYGDSFFPFSLLRPGVFSAALSKQEVSCYFSKLVKQHFSLTSCTQTLLSVLQASEIDYV